MREGRFEQFQDGDTEVLVCTDIMSRGMDTIRVRIALYPIHYVLCTVALAVMTLGKIKCIFYKVIVNKDCLLLLYRTLSLSMMSYVVVGSQQLMSMKVPYSWIDVFRLYPLST